MQPSISAAWGRLPNSDPALCNALQFPVAPHNLDVEQALLGAILVKNEVYYDIAACLQPRHFYDQLHQQIFDVARTLVAAGNHADPFTLKPYFENAPPINANLTVPIYLGKLGIKVPTTFNAREYARVIRDLWLRRQTILIGEDMLTMAYDSPVNFSSMAQLDDATGRLQSLGDIAGSELGPLLEFATDASIEALDDDIIRDVVPTAGLVLFFGPSGSGKTFLAIELAFSVALDRSFFGRETAKAPVLYVGLEGKANLNKRIVAARNRHGDPGAHLATMTRPVVFGRLPGADSSTADIIRAIRQQTKAASAPVGLVIIDTLARAMAGDNENEAAAMSAVATQAQRITAATGATVLFIHHPGKNPEKGARGSYALFGAVDAEIVLERNAGSTLSELRVKKLRDGAEGRVGAFALRRVVLGDGEHGREITTCTVDPTEGIVPPCIQTPRSHTVAGKALKELHQLLKSGKGRPARGHLRAPHNVILIAKADWQAACLVKRLGEGDDKSEKRAFRRAVSQLSAGGIIREFGSDVWLVDQELTDHANVRCPRGGSSVREDSVQPIRRTQNGSTCNTC